MGGTRCQFNYVAGGCEHFSAPDLVLAFPLGFLGTGERGSTKVPLPCPCIIIVEFSGLFFPFVLGIGVALSP